MNSKKKWIALTVILVIATNLATAFIFSRNYFFTPKNSEVAEFSKLFLVREKLYQYYDGKIDDDTLVEGAIKGMTNALNDPYTVFMDSKEFEEFSNQTEGSYVGIGIQVGVKDNKIVIIAPFDNSPAKKAGLVSGDIIEKVNGVSLTGNDLEKAVSMMKGKLNKEIKLTIKRQNQDSFDVNLKADEIKMQTVSSEMISDDVGYMRISMFDRKTDEDFNNQLKALKDKGMKKIILDLRGNPGGLLDVCVNITSNFIPKKSVIVYTIDKNKNREDFISKGGSAIGMPLVILTDEGTASASEILSGAVKDYKAGTLIGTKTFGKGVVQNLYDTLDNTALKVTIAKYYTPNGINIHHIGIKPDIEVKYPEELLKKDYDRSEDPQFKKAMETINKMK